MLPFVALNVAFAGLPAPAGSNCVPVGGHDPQVNAANYNFTGGSGITILALGEVLDG